MTFLIAVILIEFVFLKILSTRFTQLLFSVFVLMTRSRTVSVTIMTFLLFPGTVLHELSHLFTAEVLGVRTGKLTLAPESIEEAEVRSGSVMMEESDPFRRTAIGLSPLTTGSVVIFLLAVLLTSLTTGTALVAFVLPLPAVPPEWNALATGVLLYLIIVISSTMFSSKDDMKGVFPLLFALALVFLAFYVVGIRITIPDAILVQMISIFETIGKALGIAVIVNVVGTIVTYGLVKLVRKVRMI